MNYTHNGEMLRELGKRYFFKEDSTPFEKSRGISLIIDASKMGDAEAIYYVADFVLKGILSVKEGDPTEKAVGLMCNAANLGCIKARAFLNDYCSKRYDEYKKGIVKPITKGPLVDFDGEKIKINRKGIFTPVDAVLEYENGINVLTLSTNIMFLYTEPIPDYNTFEGAVKEGIMAWEGEYEVFGGQRLQVRINLTTEPRLFDNVIVAPVTSKLSSSILAAGKAIAPKKRKEALEGMIENKRSFAVNGIKWKANSRKLIFIQSNDGKFSDFDEIMHITKHEFGHALGLGDLYSCSDDNLQGVKKGTYSDLDSYAITDRVYNMVMCDYRGAISNNDIEMVVLAFSENKMQVFQPGQIKGKISKALGKGN